MCSHYITTLVTALHCQTGRDQRSTSRPPEQAVSLLIWPQVRFAELWEKYWTCSSTGPRRSRDGLTSGHFCCVMRPGHPSQMNRPPSLGDASASSALPVGAGTVQIWPIHALKLSRMRLCLWSFVFRFVLQSFSCPCTGVRIQEFCLLVTLVKKPKEQAVSGQKYSYSVKMLYSTQLYCSVVANVSHSFLSCLITFNMIKCGD